MIEELVQNLLTLKKEFVSIYDGNSQIQEVIPASKSKSFPIEQSDLELLHEFATKNPIYYNSYEKTIGDTACIVYEGDINKYWLNSIQHSSSCAPFSPTWILSAYISSLLSKSLGYGQVIDIGSGDGRIAYCAKILGLDSYSIELDEMLVELQNSISKSTGIDFNSNCSDAISFDYSSLNLSSPEFFIGGLAQMGGTALAVGVIENIQSNPELQKNTGMVFAGTFSQKYSPDPMAKSGWGTLIDKYNLKVTNTIVLPTAWTFNETDDTPYIYAKFTEL
jgi:hypothetical protein